MLEGWRERVRSLKRSIHALYLASRHPRTPWYAKVMAALVVAYALSPIDLIPDPIPVLGYLDDLLLLPLGILLTLRFVPDDVWKECKARAEAPGYAPPAASWVAAGVIVVIWIVVAVWLFDRFWPAIARAIA